ncbi:hypothetical protein M1M40_gp35 [Halorubrum tailed virus 29]|uniref:Uncharacterized protein n=1 Tax=Halorubrum tailed virus 29 TaxID=2878010 RepID=A0AAE9BZC2_9CAUD|nr:hypothetical protein M1M40_gp35 [Halorubrum tailed virus 29]UBF23313.1 hypothetical protein HRTV-29_gp35 [Halorubrum tailed virus 29]
MSDLRDDLTEIDGVGEATADKVLAVLADHGASDTDPLLEKAKAAAERGDDRNAAVFLRRAGDE